MCATRASTTVIYYEVLPPESPHTVVSTVWNEEGCDGPNPPNGCNIQNLSHATLSMSMMLRRKRYHHD